MACDLCGRRYPVEHEIADLAEGAYYDQFDQSTALSEEHLAGLRLEVDGTVRRIRDFYLPLIEREAAGRRLISRRDAGVPGAPASSPADQGASRSLAPVRILDCGCGNGISVDLLRGEGFDAWGNDLSALRKWQWQERAHRDRLVVASALSLPFPDAYFDVVLSSGVIEHIGVLEHSHPYRVAALPDRDSLRAAFLRELLRVTAPGGAVYLDCPNGRFPIDFWHGDAPGSPRFHSPREPFLPSFAEIDALANGRAVALRPYKRLQFHQAARHWYGRLLGRPMNWYFRLMPRFVAKSALNPFLVVRVPKSADPAESPAGAAAATAPRGD